MNIALSTHAPFGNLEHILPETTKTALLEADSLVERILCVQNKYLFSSIPPIKKPLKSRKIEPLKEDVLGSHFSLEGVRTDNLSLNEKLTQVEKLREEINNSFLKNRNYKLVILIGLLASAILMTAACLLPTLPLIIAAIVVSSLTLIGAMYAYITSDSKKYFLKSVNILGELEDTSSLRQECPKKVHDKALELFKVLYEIKYMQFEQKGLNAISIEPFHSRYAFIGSFIHWSQDADVKKYFYLTADANIKKVAQMFAENFYAHSLSAISQGKISALASLYYQGNKKNTLFGVIADPSEKGRGIGTALLTELCAKAKNTYKLDTLYLTAKADNPVVEPLYKKKLGFQTVSQKENIICMQKAL
jgi:N-acetylglutamate synthase-like GNAT family acetyltransferase